MNPNTAAVLHPSRVEPLPAAVLAGAAGAEDAGRAHPVAAEERLLPQEGRGQAQGRQGEEDTKVARWQNLIPSFPWIALGWRMWGHKPSKGKDQILQRSIGEP